MCRTTIRIAVVAWWLASGAHGFGASPTFRGDDERVWTNQRWSVIVATVEEVKPGPEPPAEFYATFVPRATLAGDFDSRLHPRLRVVFWVTPSFGGALSFRPAVGDTIIVVVSPPIARYRSVTAFEGRHAVPIHACGFMRDYSPIVRVRGLDDPEVAETLKRIQAVREKGRAATRPATAPATREGK